MNFRPIDYQNDLPEVIKLINMNLDPEMTVEFFKWKHYENPFGISYGLVALDNEKIIGLRMFMFWEFFNPLEGDNARVIRPVDTVTDVNYRGRGLFKKLTFHGIEECSGMYDFIFNTPNENSRPGYIKMGWESHEKVAHFKIGVVNLFKQGINYEEVNNVPEKLLKPKIPHDIYATMKSTEFLSWRYRDPQYRVAAFEEDGCYVIYKIVLIKGFPFILVFELLGDSSYFKRMLRAVCKKNNTPMVYYYDSKEFEAVEFIKTFNRAKPVVVLKEANREIFRDFNFSLGDLEGKL